MHGNPSFSSTYSNFEDFFFQKDSYNSIFEKVLPIVATGTAVRTQKHNIQTIASDMALTMRHRAIDYSSLTLFPSDNTE